MIYVYVERLIGPNGEKVAVYVSSNNPRGAEFAQKEVKLGEHDTLEQANVAAWEFYSLLQDGDAPCKLYTNPDN